jgi:predicted PurR-regulated permease PerM
MENSKYNKDLSKIIFLAIFVPLIIGAGIFVLSPFLVSFFWAIIIVISTWPIMLKLQKFLGNRKILSIFFMILFLLFLFFIPLFIIINGLMNSILLFFNHTFTSSFEFPDLSFLNNIPFIGESLFSYYNKLIYEIEYNFIFHIQPYFHKIFIFFMYKTTTLIHLLINLFLMFLFIGLLYWRGKELGKFIHNVNLRINSKSLSYIFSILGKSIQSVVLSVIITALVQGFLGGLGLMFVGFHYVVFFVVLMIFLSLIQLGSLPVLIPIVFWLYCKHSFFYGTFLLFWSLLLSILDSITRFMFIKIGINLPFYLIIFGVIGGLLSFGVIGLFIGPIILDIAYKVIISWVYKKSIPEIFDKKR